MPDAREDHDEAFRQLDAESSLLSPPPKTRQHSNAELRQLVRLLILCNNPEERAIVTLYRYHRAELADVAARVGIPLARVAELFESIRLRVKAAQDKHERERTVAQAAAGTRYQPHQ